MWQGKARRGEARLGEAWQGEARYGKDSLIPFDRAGYGKAWRG